MTATQISAQRNGTQSALQTQIAAPSTAGRAAHFSMELKKLAIPAGIKLAELTTRYYPRFTRGTIRAVCNWAHGTAGIPAHVKGEAFLTIFCRGEISSTERQCRDTPHLRTLTHYKARSAKLVRKE